VSTDGDKLVLYKKYTTDHFSYNRSGDNYKHWSIFCTVEQEGSVLFHYFLAQKNKEIRTSEMSVSLYQLQWRDTQEYFSIQGLNLRKP
jgi:hypothetical protein